MQNQVTYKIFLTIYGILELAGLAGFWLGMGLLLIGVNPLSALAVMFAGFMVMASTDYMRQTAIDDHKAEQESFQRLSRDVNKLRIPTLKTLNRYGYEFVINDGKIAAVIWKNSCRRQRMR